MNILIKNIDILTANSDKDVIRQGFIGIRDGMIEFVSPTDENAKGFPADKVIDGKYRLAIPGLVNAHTHSAMTLLRNFGNDMALEEWLFQKVFPAEAKLTDEYVYWGTLLGIAEMIKSGITAFADMYLHMEAAVRAVAETGIRANLSYSPLRYTGGNTPQKIDDTQRVIRFHKDWNQKNNGRILASVQVHSAYLFNEADLENSAGLAKELGMGIQIHVLETAREREKNMQQYGMSSAEICLKTGIFDVPVIAAHCVHCSDRDLEIIKAKGVFVAHNPTSNMKLGSGFARIPDMLERGIHVALGTDGAASNNNLNMFEEINLAALIHKGARYDPLAVSAGDAFLMATRNGADALGFGGITGKIRKGMRADLTLINTDQPHLCPMNNPISAIAYAAQAADVDTVMVDGEILMENRILKTIDEERIKEKVREIANRMMG